MNAWPIPFASKRISLPLLCGFIFTTLLVYYRGSITKSAHRRGIFSSKVIEEQDKSLTQEEQCVREVLIRLKLPLSLDRYLLTHPLPQELPIRQLSPACRAFLTPNPVSRERQKQLACFLPKPWFDTFGPTDRLRIDGALRLLAEAFRLARVPIHLDAGTALGSWRMHGQIPYDPDVDLLILHRHKTEAKAILEKLMATHSDLFRHYVNGNFWRMNVIRTDDTRLFQVDIFVHKLDDKKMIVKQVQSPSTLYVRQLLPFVMRPFQGILFPTWRNRTAYLTQVYGEKGLKECKPAPWIASFFKIKCLTRTVKCSELNYFYNFVHRWIQPNDHSVEVLFNRTHTLSVFHAPEGR